MTTFNCIPFFEANTVLTANRLNDIVNHSLYNDRQNRILLFGMGIVCGFEVRFETTSDLPPSYRIVISEGVGITSLGDLIKSEECVLSHHRDVNLQEKDFFRNCEEAGFTCNVEDGDIRELLSFNAPEAEILPSNDLGFYDNKVVVLLLQKCVIDDASGCFSDCDDSGKEICFKLRKLLVRKDCLPVNNDFSIAEPKDTPNPIVKTHRLCNCNEQSNRCDRFSIPGY